MSLGEAGVDTQSFLQLLDLSLAVRFLVVRLAKVVPSVCEIGVQRQCLLQCTNRLVSIDHDQDPAEVRSGVRVIGPDSNGLAERGDGLFGLVDLRQYQAEVVMRFCILGIQPDRLAEGIGDLLRVRSGLAQQPGQHVICGRVFGTCSQPRAQGPDRQVEVRNRADPRRKVEGSLEEAKRRVPPSGLQKNQP